MDANLPISSAEVAAAAARLIFPKSRYTSNEAVRIALERFVAGPAMNHCAPSVIMTLQEAYDLPGGALMPWVANSFQGGVCSGEICGVLSGAAIAYGLLAYQVLPHTDHDRRVAALANVPNIRALKNGFQHKFGAVKCSDLTRKGLMTPEDTQRFIKERGWRRTCSPYLVYVMRAMVKEPGY